MWTYSGIGTVFNLFILQIYMNAYAEIFSLYLEMPDRGIMADGPCFRISLHVLAKKFDVFFCSVRHIQLSYHTKTNYWAC